MKIVVQEWEDWIKIDVDGERHVDMHNYDLSFYDLLDMLSQLCNFDLEYTEYEGYDE